MEMSEVLCLNIFQSITQGHFGASLHRVHKEESATELNRMK